MENNINSTLFNIQSELEDYKLDNSFYDNVNEILNFYIESIFKTANNNVLKKINKPKNNFIDKEFINQFDIEDFINELKKQYGLNNKDKIIFIIIGKLIQFYKMSQVYVFGINGYEKIYVDMNINTCEICKNRFKDGIDLTKDIDETIFHPYCKTVFKGEKNEKINK